VYFHLRSFRAADYYTDHCLTVAKVRERLAVSKQTTHRVHMERFNLKKLKETEDKERYQLHEVSYVNIIFTGRLILSVCIGM
jgi:hypothetical protein